MFEEECDIPAAISCAGKNTSERRTLETRLEEHNGEARRRTVDKPWGDHMRANHAGINLGVGDSIFSAVSVVARASDRASRKLREAVEIRNEGQGPEINTSAGCISRSMVVKHQKTVQS
eukprot:scpid61907/ scgid33780/ 